MYTAELEAAMSARKVLSQALRDVLVEERIRKALAQDWFIVPTTFRPFENESNAFINHLRKINPRRYQVREYLEKL